MLIISITLIIIIIIIINNNNNNNNGNNIDNTQERNIIHFRTRKQTKRFIVKTIDLLLPLFSFTYSIINQLKPLNMLSGTDCSLLNDKSLGENKTKLIYKK